MQSCLGEIEAGGYMQIIIGGNSTNLRLFFEAAGVVPTRPAVESASVLAFRASEIF